MLGCCVGFSLFVASVDEFPDLLLIDSGVAIVVCLLVVVLVIYCCRIFVFVCLLVRVCLTYDACLFSLWFVVDC